MRIGDLGEVERVEQCAEGRDAAGDSEQRLLRLSMPADELDREQAQAPREMRGEQKNKHDLGKLQQRSLGPGKKSVERAFTAQSLAERKEMQRQEEREQQSRNAVNEECPIGGMTAIAPIES